MFTLLRQRNLALLFAGQVISSVGDWILWIALPFYVYAQTGSTVAMGSMFIVNNLPTILFGSLAGVFVDRWDRRRTMIGTDLLRALLLLVLLFVDRGERIWLIYPVTFLLATVAQFFRPARSAILPALVNQEELAPANTLNAAGGDLAMLVGPAVGGLLFARIGFAGVVLIDVASFLLSALLIAGITMAPMTPNTVLPLRTATATPSNLGRRLYQEWLDGLTVIRTNSTLRVIAIFTTLEMVGNGIILVLWAVYVQTVLHRGAAEYGWIQIAVALGGLSGALLLPKLQRFASTRRLVALSGICVGLLLLATFHTQVLSTIFVLQFGMGIVAVAFAVLTETLIQLNAPVDYLGRVFGANQMVQALALLGGQILGTVLANQLGIGTMLELAALFILLSGVTAWALLPAKRTVAIRAIG